MCAATPGLLIFQSLFYAATDLGPLRGKESGFGALHGSSHGGRPLPGDSLLDSLSSVFSISRKVKRFDIQQPAVQPMSPDVSRLTCGAFLQEFFSFV